VHLGEHHVSVAQFSVTRRPVLGLPVALRHASENTRVDPRSRASGVRDRGGKGSHRNFVHPKVARPVGISGNQGDDAKHYQETAVRRAIEEAKR
jgi:hypothetical protein